MTGAGMAGASASTLRRGAARNLGLPSARPQPPGFCRVEGLALPADLPADLVADLAADLAAVAGLALALGAAFPFAADVPEAAGLPFGAAAFFAAGRLLLAAGVLAAGVLAADFLAGAFSGLVLGSGYVSAWVASDMPSGWNDESDARGFGGAVQGPRAAGSPAVALPEPMH